MESQLEKRRLSNKLLEEQRDLAQGDGTHYIRPELKPDFEDEDLIRRLKMMETTDGGGARNTCDGPTICANQKVFSFIQYIFYMYLFYILYEIHCGIVLFQ